VRRRPCENRSREKQSWKKKMLPLALKMKEGAMSQGRGILWKLEKRRKEILPRSL